MRTAPAPEIDPTGSFERAYAETAGVPVDAVQRKENAMTGKTDELLNCPFCQKAMMLRAALWPSEGDRDAIIHAAPTDCPLGDFSNDTFDRSIVEVWNRRAPAQPAVTGEALTKDDVAVLDQAWRESSALVSAPADPAPARADVVELIDEGLEILNSLIDNIKRKGNYSPESTCVFLDQAGSSFRAARTALSAQGWRDMASAPKDGTSILAVINGRHAETGVPFIPEVVEWDGENWSNEMWGDQYVGYYDPTHWMPLPTSPLAQEAGR